jgi:hypothetical protein
MAIDTAQLISDIKNAATSQLGTDVTLLRGYSEQQLGAIAQQSDMVAGGLIDGSITSSTQDYFLDSIEEMVKSFLNTLAGLISVMIEEMWNAIVKVIWSAINTATGLALVVP